MVIYDPAPLLPVTRLEANTGATRHVGSMILLPSDTYSDLLRYLAHMAQVGVDDVTPFLQRSTTKEIVRITGDADLRREQPMSLIVVVGLCTVCDKEVDGVPVEFHPCPLDEVVGATGFKSKVGPIQRPRHVEA